MLILDGGMGTLLQERGLTAGETPEDWNVERPDDIAEIHRAYADALCDFVFVWCVRIFFLDDFSCFFNL